MAKKRVVPIENEPLYQTQKAYYHRVYHNRTAPPPWQGVFDETLLRRWLSTINARSDKWAIDIGTGHGRGAAVMAAAGYRTIGLDYLFEPLRGAAAAKQPGGATGKRLRFITADFFAPCFAPDHHFDVILDWGLFHHIRRRETTTYLSVIDRLLAPGGTLLLGCFSPNFRHEGEGERRRNFTLHHGHYDRYSTINELRRWFEPMFLIEEIEEDERGGFYFLKMKKGG